MVTVVYPPGEEDEPMADLSADHHILAPSATAAAWLAPVTVAVAVMVKVCGVQVSTEEVLPPTQLNPLSALHASLHPSPSITLPSSQASEPTRKPSPQ
jgi:hypothetical protein